METFAYAELDMQDAAQNHLLTAQLAPNPANHRQPENAITVAFSVAPNKLTQCGFLIVCSDGIRGHHGYLLRVEKFLNAKDFASAEERTRTPLPVDTDQVAGETVGKNGFPTGNSTPEGAATDLVRAFIDRDFDRFNAARTKNSCEGRNDPHNYYAAFLQHTTLIGDTGQTAQPDSLNEPDRISRVYKARYLPHDELELDIRTHWIAIYGRSDRSLVDVAVSNEAGDEFLHRTIVYKATTNGKWYAHAQLNHDDHLHNLAALQPKSTDLYSPTSLE
ncbi:hypothetical protein [Novipirellula rosea]